MPAAVTNVTFNPDGQVLVMLAAAGTRFRGRALRRIWKIALAAIARGALGTKRQTTRRHPDQVYGRAGAR